MEDLATQLIAAIQSRAWWPVVGIAAALLVGVGRNVLPSYWASIPSQWKPLPAGALVLLAAVADAFTAGLTWQVALVMVAAQVATAWPTAVGAADAALRLTGNKAPSLASIERDVQTARAMVGKLPPVTIVLLVSVLLGGCSLLRSAAPAAAGLAASNATQACSLLRGSDRDVCMVLAGLVEANEALIEQAVRDSLEEGQACPVAAPAPSSSAAPVVP
jgi:hypothetical protein